MDDLIIFILRKYELSKNLFVKLGIDTFSVSHSLQDLNFFNSIKVNFNQTGLIKCLIKCNIF